MRFSVLNQSSEIAIAEYKKNKRVIAVSVCSALAFNVLVTVITNENNIKLFLVLNILIDILAGVFAYTLYATKMKTQKKLIDIYEQEREIIIGRVEQIAADTTTYISLECVEVKIDGRVLFLPIDSIELAVGEKVTVYHTANVIVEVEKC